jgi:anti-anti-sigma regulatory factor
MSTKYQASSINILSLSGFLNRSKADEIYQEVMDSITQGAEVIIIDLRDVSLIDEMGSNILSSCSEKASEYGIHLFVIS